MRSTSYCNKCFHLHPPPINKYQSEGLIHEFSEGSGKYYVDTVFIVVFYATCAEVWIIPRPSIQMKCADFVVEEASPPCLSISCPLFSSISNACTPSQYLYKCQINALVLTH